MGNSPIIRPNRHFLKIVTRSCLLTLFGLYIIPIHKFKAVYFRWQNCVQIYQFNSSNEREWCYERRNESHDFEIESYQKE